jgi:L-fuconolactonase
VFGTERMMFGSDWPVATVAASYRRWYDTARQLVSGLSDDEQAQIFAENAATFYRLKRK